MSHKADHYILGSDATPTGLRLHGICFEKVVMKLMRKHASVSLAILDMCRTRADTTNAPFQLSPRYRAAAAAEEHPAAGGACGFPLGPAVRDAGQQQQQHRERGGIFLCWATAPHAPAAVMSGYTNFMIR
ncbi:hypothetical protein PLESTB_000942300 [Pleodorina starrii]|uniref:Uncharacterized protein n=1 Tax=Pleodorina starrii TaxID=330485 RepID=A0A9W6BN83_9CHLO|nr:hypothetical protein PLESTB_000942300 [Pleodorina starrii]